MSIPANVTADLTTLQAQVVANTPLGAASQAAITAMQLNASQLVTDAVSALASAAGTLDTWTTPVDPAAIISGVLGLSGNASDQSALADLGGIVGRIAANLDQLGATSASGTFTPRKFTADSTLITADTTIYTADYDG